MMQPLDLGFCFFQLLLNFTFLLNWRLEPYQLGLIGFEAVDGLKHRAI